MDELREWYKEGLYSRIEALQVAKHGLTQGGKDVRDSIRRIAHALRGSGATYGFDGISQAAEELEDCEDNDMLQKTEALISVLQDITADNKKKETCILIVEDDPAIQKILANKLEGPNRKIYAVGDIQKAEKLLAEKQFSLIILDLIFPDSDGRTLLINIRQDPRIATIPVIVLSARTAPHTKIECFALGADDYFEKPFDPDTLALAVSTKLQRWAEISWESHRDTLTELPNRASFEETYLLMKSLAVRQKEPLCLGMLDLDHFKSVNDSYGHIVGDEVLKSFASIVNRSLRKSDFLARWGGEEFLVLFPNTTLKGAKNALQKALDRFSKHVFTTKASQSFSVTFSAGIVRIDESYSMDEDIDRSDRVLYRAKSEGRNLILLEAPQ